MKYVPINSDTRNENEIMKPEANSKNRKMTLKEIYEEFWEFIDEENSHFQKFITNDNRRKKFSTKYQIDGIKNQLEIQSI